MRLPKVLSRRDVHAQRSRSETAGQRPSIWTRSAIPPVTAPGWLGGAVIFVGAHDAVNVSRWKATQLRARSTPPAAFRPTGRGEWRSGRREKLRTASAD